MRVNTRRTHSVNFQKQTVSPPKLKISAKLLRYVLIISISSFSFGYNTGSIAGALIFIKEEFELSSLFKGIVVSCILIGALVGSMIGGKLADDFGRRNTFVFSAVPYFIGAVGMALAPDVYVLVGFRTLSGLAVGVSSTLCNMYISEISPAAQRGQLGGLAPFSVTFGILISYVLSYAFAEVTYNWRWMLGISVGPAVLQLLLGLTLPESPRWLMKQRNSPTAAIVLAQLLHGSSNDQQLLDNLISQELECMEAAVHAESYTPQLSCLSMCRNDILSALLVGIGLNMLQQLSGVNVVVYFSPTVLVHAGFSNTNATLFTALVGLTQLLATFVLMRLVDSCGRKPLSSFGLVGMIIGLGALGASFLPQLAKLSFAKWIAVSGMLIFRVFFSFSLGPLPYIITAEIFPADARSAGIALSWSANWIFNFAVSLTFLFIVDAIGAAYTFFGYTAVSFFALLFLWCYVPETAGKSLDALPRGYTALEEEESLII